MTNFDLHKFNLEIFDFGRILINTKLHRSCLAVRAAPSNDYAYLLIQGANKLLLERWSIGYFTLRPGSNAVFHMSRTQFNYGGKMEDVFALILCLETFIELHRLDSK